MDLGMSPHPTVAVLRTGIMGGPMARNLLATASTCRCSTPSRRASRRASSAATGDLDMSATFLTSAGG
jgi:3-hydroxyisobutyrate dehydrogenase-like beta-hydroxyacid dehydrogenase